MNTIIKLIQYSRRNFCSVNISSIYSRIEVVKQSRLDECFDLHYKSGVIEGDPLTYYLYTKDKANSRNYQKEFYHRMYNLGVEEGLGYNLIDNKTDKVVANILVSDSHFDDNLEEDLKKYEISFKEIEMFNQYYDKYPQYTSSSRKGEYVFGTCVVVDYNYRKMGLFRQMYEHQLEEIKKRGYKIFFTTANSVGTMTYFKNQNSTILEEVKYNQIKDSNGKIMFPDFDEVISQRTSGLKNDSFYVILSHL